MNPTILFEDTDLLAIDKPAGMVINDAITVEGRETLQSWISQNIHTEISKNPEYRSGIIHRLDKPTSGIVLVAKTAPMFLLMQKLFSDRTVQKTYSALVHGQVTQSKGEIIAKIGRLPQNRMHFGVIESGRDAVTHYSVQSQYKSPKGERVTLLSFFPKTGRTHQLRVHAKHIHHPIVSDPQYVGRKTLRQDLLWCPRLFLHAQKIVFMHPNTKQSIEIESPLPSDLQTVLDTCSQISYS